MKIDNYHSMSRPLVTFILIAAVFSATADSGGNAPESPLTNNGQIVINSAYHVVQRDANSRVWERTVMERSGRGKMEAKTHRYVELATGLNYQKNGQWVEARPAIDILPDGRAAATQGQHQCFFPADINEGVIETVTSDGKHLQSRPLGLSYGDGSNTVLIAELKDAVGYVAGTNQVVYPDAFTGLKADVRYTYTIAGIEQDIILREQPPAPECFGLKTGSARLQVLTEFLNSPEPASAARLADAQAGLTDHQLTFGSLKMIQGRAFAAAGNPLQGTPVFKSWQHSGTRRYLVEEVPLNQIRRELGNLPARSLPVSLAGGKDPVLYQVAAARLLPPFHAGPPAARDVRLARNRQPEAGGFILDYFAVNFTDLQANFTFKSDTTYFLSNAYFVDSGTDVIEGGTVIKFDSGTASMNLTGPLVSCQTGPYRPAIFTARDDNSVGETVAGSTGVPSGYYGLANSAVVMAYYNENLQLHDLRFSYLKTALAVNANSATLANVQFINCGIGIKMSWDNVTINNALFSGVNQAIVDAGGSPSLTGTFLTADNCGTIAGGNLSTVNLADCLFAATTNLVSGANTTLVTNDVVITASDAGVFQTVGAGAHYLANGSPYRNAGTTNVSPAVLAGIAARTTYPPVVWSNISVSAPTNFTVQAARDSDTPDLGYHYDAVDYITDGVTVSGTTLAMSNGVAIVCYNEPGITLENGASLVSVGTPLLPNWFSRYQSVQEQAVALGGANPQAGQNVAAVWSPAAPSSGSFIFSHFAAIADGGPHFASTGPSAYGALTVRNSEIWGGRNDFSGASAASATVLENNLFYRTTLFASNTSPQTVLSVSNNLLLQSAITLAGPGSNAWTFFDNAVDSSSIAPGSVITAGYNAYINGSAALPATSNVTVAGPLGYQAGPLGNFYQPPGSPLMDAGSTTADQAGLYHFTTQASQAKEANSRLDIGYHYVAADGSGNPVDSNNDGVPDYLEDANGNGLADGGEPPWMAAPVITLQPTNQVLYPGSNIVLNAAAASQVLNLQWYDNSAPLPGQTNGTLVIFNAQITNSGVYYLAASNSAGVATSSNAVLGVLQAPVIVTQPASQAVLQSSSTTLSVGASGLFMNYQWFSNSVPVPGATSSTLTIQACAVGPPANYYVVITNTAGAVTSSNAVLTVNPITSQTVICAASGSFADVSNAVASAQPGNLVLIPPGTYVWTQSLSLNGVSLRGCGTNQTIILDGVSPNLNNGIMIYLYASTNGLTEMSNFQITYDPTNTTPTYQGIVVAMGNAATPWRIDHMFFNELCGKNIATYGNAMSVIDHNLFLTESIGIWAASYGDQYASYSTPAAYGLNSSNVLYVEDNYFTNVTGVPRQVIDGCGGARMVLRYNTIWNDNCGNHGTETGGSLRSQRTLEVYGNTFTYAPGLANVYNQYFAVCLFRGGSGVFFSNTASGFQSLVALRNLRNTDDFYGQYYPYNGANGTNPWDSNNPTLFLTGNHTGPNAAYYLQVAGANWTPNQWVGYTLNNTNSGLFSEVISNDANTMYYIGTGVVHNTVMSFNTGDGFTLRQVYATIDQPGRGSGDLLQENGFDANGNLIVINTTTGTPSWPHEVIEPLYFWANTLNGGPAEAISPYPTIQAGRDFFNDTPKPGYTPFQYPHPLTLINVH